jgi:hypothetical protein
MALATNLQPLAYAVAYVTFFLGFDFLEILLSLHCIEDLGMG